MKQAMEVLTSSNTNEWYTPERIIGLVKLVMGNIDLDPASCEFAQRWIKADNYFTKEDSGLTKNWYGRVFLNPPYGKTGNHSNQDIWATKLIDEIYTERVCEAILLTKTVPGYAWWDTLFNFLWPGPMCITLGRLSFVNMEDKIGKSKVASSFWYFGKNEEKFEYYFSKIGRIIFPPL